MAIERQTIFKCDGCVESQTTDKSASAMLPEGWQLLKCTNDETSYFVKLACAKCFARVTAVFRDTWGIPATKHNEARG